MAGCIAYLGKRWLLDAPYEEDKIVQTDLQSFTKVQGSAGQQKGDLLNIRQMVIMLWLIGVNLYSSGVLNSVMVA